MTKLMAALLILLLTGGFLSHAAEPAQKLPAPESVMIVGIRSVSNMPTVQSVRVTPGYVKNRCGTMAQTSQPGRNTEPLLVLTNTNGQAIYSTAFGYPTAQTIPPRPADSPASASPDVIALSDPEVFLVVPYSMETAGVEIFYPGEPQPRFTAALDTLDVRYEPGNHSFSTRPAPSFAAERNFHVLIIASGYHAGDLPEFTAKAEALRSYFLSWQPFTAYASMTEVHIYANTEDLGCYNGCSGIARLMCCNGNDVIAAASASGYLFDEIIVLHNTDTYSGGGYRSASYENNSYSSYAMIYSGEVYKEMALHEFGHSFGNLCDEYTYSSEGYGYSPCVNCRADCGDWASITQSCQISCDARNDYYRPEDSIMLSLSIPYFNGVSIFAVNEPHGLERRLRFFTGQSSLVYLTLQGERKEDHAWLIKMHYAELSLTVDNPDDLPISTFLVFRDAHDGAGFRQVREFQASALQDNTLSFLDEHLIPDVYYTYKVEVLDPEGKLIGASGMSSL